MGSVTPLIAVAEWIKNGHPSFDFFWIGTKDGPEKKVVKANNINFYSIICGKWRRYASWRNLADVVRIIIGFGQAMYLVKKIRPNIIVSAGGYVAVPVIWAGWIMGVPSIIHQQDVRPGLANKLCAWCADKITVCFPDSARYFNKKKVIITGNPVRESLREAVLEESRQKALDFLGLRSDMPVVLVTSGGVGAIAINEMTSGALKELIKFCQVIHITGKNKVAEDASKINNYRQYEFLVDMAPALLAADIVVARAGMGTLTEIAYLGKAAIVIPIPNSHQEDNARYFKERRAVETIEQDKADADIMTEKITGLLNNKKRCKEIGQNVYKAMSWGAEEKISKIILSMER